MTNLAPLMSSTRPDWNTPECVLERVRLIDTIGLDPCSNATSIVHARREWDGLADQDGLFHVWLNYGLVYVNPPYGRGIIAWAKKMADEGAGVNGAEIVTLLPARTDARWWQDYVAQAAAICFWRGRLRFLGAPASAPFPSAVAYWGQRCKLFRSAFVTAGWMVG